MKKVIIFALATILSGGMLSAQVVTTQSTKSKSVLETRRVQPQSIALEKVEKFEAVVAAGEPEPPVATKDFKSEAHFKTAYGEILSEYLEAYETANKEYVELNARIDIARAKSMSNIASKTFSKAYSPTEVDYKRQELVEKLEKTVEETRTAKLNELQASYNAAIAAIDQRKTVLDSALSTSEFVINVDACVTKYDNISKTWKFKFTSTNPDVKFSTDWLTLKLDREALEEQYEELAPKIEAGIRAKAYYSVSVMLPDGAPEDLTQYERRVSRIEIFDTNGKSIGLFPVDVPADSWTWNSFKRQLFVE